MSKKEVGNSNYEKQALLCGFNKVNIVRITRNKKEAFEVSNQWWSRLLHPYNNPIK